jgi:hypothetical protein
MNHIIIIFLSIILPILSLKAYKPKLCINCKHFIDDSDSPSYGKCSLFVKEEDTRDFLVTGIKGMVTKEYHYCSTSRWHDGMCGEEGKMYKKKYTKKSN